ncbi:MAG: type I DNA topoisomerase, partial [Erysipelotrichia bacterium]|nr:type I DNA topoisomerase [Erysipelotrichia bacterium]
LGHIRDLAKSGKGGLGVDVSQDFSPTYIINKNKQHIINDLKKSAKQCNEVIIATAPDREGEAIAWHLTQVLGLDVDKTKRLEFHEITRESINEALASPRTIDKNLVCSQEARRIIDRIIGFKLSTLLYKKIRSRSGGRVQSATLCMIKSHDEEIEKFVPEEYWTIATKIEAFNEQFALSLVVDHGKSVKLSNSEQAHDLLARIPENLTVQKIDKKIKTSESRLPFTTSTLQQEAFSRLRFKTKKTQVVAQKLYEGIEVDGEHVGLITYMRTDSTRLSPTFVARATAYISKRFGKEYLGRVKKSKQSGNQQNAHEAIRPTSVYRTPESVRKFLTHDQYNLYRLIYNRTLASLMKGRKDEVMTVHLSGNNLEYKIDFTRVVFPGYEAIYKGKDKGDDYPEYISGFAVGIEVPVIEKSTEQKFTQPPAHYTEAKVVKMMEEEGIGRPSTYASTIETLRLRKYIDNEKGTLKTSKQGKLTATVLRKYFPEIVDVKYTALMEKKLDEIEDGNESRSTILKEFYYPFMELYEEVSEKMYKEELEPTGEDCPQCGSPLVIKDGRNGQFVGCSNFPACKYVKKDETKASKVTPIGEKCPECGGELLLRENRGSAFISCGNFPKCYYTRNVSTSSDGGDSEQSNKVKDCPKCDGYLVKKKGRYSYFLGCINYPECRHMERIYVRKRK